MKEYDIIAEGGYTTTRIPETTLINDCRRERVIPPLVAMIFPTSKRSGIQRTVTRRMSKLTPIPMPGGNDLSALREIVFFNLLIQALKAQGATRWAGLIRRDMRIKPSRIRACSLIP